MSLFIAIGLLNEQKKRIIRVELIEKMRNVLQWTIQPQNSVGVTLGHTLGHTF